MNATRARNNALFNSGSRGMQGILDPRFLLFHLDLRGGANSDNRHAPTILASRSWSFSRS